MKCFYHDDLDGLCSAAIVSKKYPGIECFNINYGQTFPWDKIEKDELIIMVDFSLPIEDMKRLNELSDFIWIDHHVTSLNAYRDSDLKIEGLIAIGDAGCELTWKYFFSNVLTPTIVDLLGDYDVYRSYKNQKHWNANVYATQLGVQAMSLDEIQPNSSFWEETLNHNDDIIDEIKRYGAIIINYQVTQDIAMCMSSAFELDWKGYKFCAINRRGGSVMLDSVYETDKHDGVITFYWTNNNTWSISIYSDKPHLDFSPIAKEYGGGGHANACGFEVEDLPFSTISY